MLDWFDFSVLEVVGMRLYFANIDRDVNNDFNNAPSNQTESYWLLWRSIDFV